ncbi:MAG TPA: tellurite resistance TerB C-terminal domain-containing protein [Ktedonobacteraceae bacterium]
MLIERFLEQEYTASLKPAGPVISIDHERLAMLQKDSEEVRSMLTVEDNQAMEDVAQEMETMVERRENGRQEQETHDEVSQESVVINGSVVSGVPLFETDVLVQQVQVGQQVDPDYTGSDQEIVWDTSGLDEDWLLFAGQLGQAHLETLYALKETIDSVKEIAEKYGTMPALLLDEINELAMETIGDLVLDGESIAEDYIDNFALLGRNGRGGVE